MLIVLSGLPGTGKTTIGKALAARYSAVFIRVDEIEHALMHRSGVGPEIGSAGYFVAFAIASSNLKLGNLVIADCVNPVPESRKSWREVVRGIAGAQLLEVEIICSDATEHRRRVEQRAPDIVGFALPTWSSVQSHDYAAWIEPRLIVDTAVLEIEDAVKAIETELARMRAAGSPSLPAS